MAQYAGVLENPLNDDYEMQFYGFTPKGFVDTVHNTIDVAGENAIRKSVHTKYSELISAALLEKLTQDSRCNIIGHEEFQKSTVMFEQGCRHQFKIKSNVVLPEDRVQIGPGAMIDEKEKESVVEKLQRQIIKERVKIEAKERRLRMLAAMNTLKGPLAVLKNKQQPPIDVRDTV